MPTPGQVTLLSLRTSVRQRADMVGSQFVTDSELTGYVNGSYFELYDLLVEKYGDNYYVATAYTFTTDGTNDQFALPDGSGAPAAFYKLLGVDVQTEPGIFASIKPFNFAERNALGGVGYPSRAGRTRLRYRLNGGKLWLREGSGIPQSGQTIQLWYVPRPTTLVNDTDVMDGVSGWEELVVIDAAIKCLQKEESDVSVLGAQKAAMLKRIEDAAENRDAAAPASVSDVRGSGDGSWPWNSGEAP